MNQNALMLAATAIFVSSCSKPLDYVPSPDARPDGADAAGMMSADGVAPVTDGPAVDNAQNPAAKDGSPADKATDGPCGSPDDPKNCGMCHHDCTSLKNVRAGGTVQCQAGKCVVPAAACVDGYGH